MLVEPLQCTLADGVPLSEVTFVVVDLETTGGSPTDHAITEVGAVTYRGGERLSTFQTLVDPRQPIPPYVAHLTGTPLTAPTLAVGVVVAVLANFSTVSLPSTLAIDASTANSSRRCPMMLSRGWLRNTWR